MLTLAILLLAQAASHASGDPWQAVFEGQPGIAAVAASSHPGVDLQRPLFNCPRLSDLPARGIAAFNLKIDAGSGRRTDIDVSIAELPPAFNALEKVKAAGATQDTDDMSCVLSKSGVSLLQVGRYWIGLPTLCRKGYYKSAVTAVLQALHRSRPNEFPEEFIYAPCGTMLLRTRKTEDFLRPSGQSPSNPPLQRTDKLPPSGRSRDRR
jgi:hypothetical protein